MAHINYESIAEELLKIADGNSYGDEEQGFAIDERGFKSEVVALLEERFGYGDKDD